MSQENRERRLGIAHLTPEQKDALYEKWHQEEMANRAKRAAERQTNDSNKQKTELSAEEIALHVVKHRDMSKYVCKTERATSRIVRVDPS